MLRLVGILAVVLAAYLFLHSPRPSVSDTKPVVIDEMLASPRLYDGKDITVEGVVTGGVGVWGLGGFHLRQKNGQREIFVASASGIPPAGTTVFVSGIFRQAVTVGAREIAVIILRP
jgi:hypothetical protein